MRCSFNNSDSKTSPSDCDSYLTNPSEKIGSYYNGNLSVPFKKKYKLPVSNDNNKNSLRFLYQFMDANDNPSFLVKVFDSENVHLKNNISSILLQSITQANTYEFYQGDAMTIYLSRSIKKIIIPNWKAIMGFQPDYDIKPYLKSRSEVARAQYNAKTFITVQGEADITTVLNTFGLIGGAWSLAVAVYKLLFGDDAIQPFGFIQKHGYFHKQTKENLTKFLSALPLVQFSDSSNNIDYENHAKKLEKKINDLELFLRDYVVEVQQLDKAYKNLENSNDK
ncbi:37348_t:CDS:2 [Gigaspora margarita]|uniref:37348_t:CDS:1 n=1 Tax=Gigaspora margarita TaxID=4874 RepID=A0ABN7VFM1_GIGMA|nr:37348_t:CDS:2 [Gigaspora margarita]